MSSAVDIAIIGGGAAGLAAGIFAGETRTHLRIVILDSARTIGAKILVSGGGRCNVTNQEVKASDFHGNRKIIDRILRRFDEQAAIRWFTSLGISLQTEPTGKIFPATNTARTVLNGLLQRCEALALSIFTEHHVKGLRTDHQAFLIEHAQGTLQAKRVILATGGRSLPKSGSDGSGWSIANRLGHTVNPVYPALVPLVLDPGFVHAQLSGISQDVSLSTTVAGKTIDRRSGSLLWTHFGISGPVVLDASRFWVMAHEQGQDVQLSLNCFPESSPKDIDQWIVQAGSRSGRKTIQALLGERLPMRVGSVLAGSLRPDLPVTPVHQLQKELRRSLVQTLTNLSLPVIGSRGWNFAEVTAGGVPLEEINPSSMESRLIPGLYLIGEMLDCDGRIGGFNFQWAWATGYLAGFHAASSFNP